MFQGYAMSRPCCKRRITGRPGDSLFKPAAVPRSLLEEVRMSLDEFEAIRLVDLKGLHQEEAASRMRVSRQTLGRILERGRWKVADALAHGKALRIAGGNVKGIAQAFDCCPRCRSRNPLSLAVGVKGLCPSCRRTIEESQNR
jgi:predicted DNA-binding protein (UPF0251 family)